VTDPTRPTRPTEPDPGTLQYLLGHYLDWRLRRDDTWDDDRGHSWDGTSSGLEPVRPIDDVETVFVAEDAVWLVGEVFEVLRRIFQPTGRAEAAQALSDLAGWAKPADSADPHVVRVAANIARETIAELATLAGAPTSADPTDDDIKADVAVIAAAGPEAVAALGRLFPDPPTAPPGVIGLVVRRALGDA
jgi:hypothetical protein